MTILLTGGSGYLGMYLGPFLADRCTLHAAHHTHPPASGRPVSLNLADREAVLQCFDTLRPNAVVNAAAVNPGGGTPEQMQAVNARGAGHVAEGAAQVGARLVHVSTDMVHSGHHAPYADEASPTPINPYGQTKAAGEKAVLGHHPVATVVRTSLIYGRTHMDRGTAGFARRLATGEAVTLFTDAIRQPIDLHTLSEALWRLVQLPYAGPLNVAGGQALSRADFGRKMLAFWQVEGRDRVREGRAAAVSERIPLDLRLRLTRAERVLGMSLPGVDQVLHRHRYPPPSY